MDYYLAVWVGAAGGFALLHEYAYWVETSHPTAPGEPIAVWLGNWTWVPILHPAAHVSVPPVPGRAPPVTAVATGRLGDRSQPSVLWSASFALNGGSDYTNAQNEHVRNPFAPAVARRHEERRERRTVRRLLS